MLKIKKIKKSYKTGDFVQDALKGVSTNFRKNEFVAILGQSGSGKTTLLNIIGGLDRYDGGDLLINNASTKKFKSKDWDAYRNNCIGFIFQSYNLITHISLLSNVEMSMTLSNISKSKRKKRALKALEDVGLKEHAYKKPNQLSGGQMQRVAIARALVNNPDIILADEPTGALDSNTSKQVMEIIKNISKDKLVIMVTHNKEIADKYASRTIELKDGEIINDTNPYEPKEDESKLVISKTKMAFSSALGLSFNNILTKKGRTILTSLASSIGIIGIALILSLSNGFNIQIEDFEKNSLSSMPIEISSETMKMIMSEEDVPNSDLELFPKEKEVYVEQSFEQSMYHNNLSENLINEIEKIDENYIAGLSYDMGLNLNMLYKSNSDKIEYLSSFTSSFTSLPADSQEKIFNENFDLLDGRYPENKNEAILVVGENNAVNEGVLKLLGQDTEEESIKFNELLGSSFKVVLNNDYYQETMGYYLPNQDYDKLYDNKNNIGVEVVGIIRNKDGVIPFIQSGISYSDELANEIININKDSNIVKSQKSANYNVLSGEKVEESEKNQMISYLGGSTSPTKISIYPTDFDSKEEIVKVLDNYNEKQKEEDKIIYTDYAEMITSLSGSIMDGITIVLIAFSAISLVVSSIMIGIITYISVLERTKEIGILRSLGARKKDITRVFNAETSLIGLFSGLLGIGITLLLLIPTNIIIESLTDLENVAVLNVVHAIILIVISFTLTVIAGLIPAYMASKKDPVNALRSE